MTQHDFDIHVSTAIDRPSGIRLRAVREAPTRDAPHQLQEQKLLHDPRRHRTRIVPVDARLSDAARVGT
jgi:hypothetical protein